MAEETKAQWGTPDKVFQTTETMQRVETVRAFDRMRVNNLANGGRPYSEAEMKEYQHQLNVNWLELQRKLQDATGQINNAFIPNGNFFTATSNGGAPAKRTEYGQKFTKLINKVLKRGKSGKRHHYVLRSRNASVALHGIGPLMWKTKTRLLPTFIPLEDLLIPTDTLLDFSTNLSYFAVNIYPTPGELIRWAFKNKEVDPGWNKKALEGIIKFLNEQSGNAFFPPDANDWSERPEAIAELYKQNSGYLESDAVPKCKMRAFYYYDTDTKKWLRKIILRENYGTVAAKGDTAEFIYDSKEPFADDIDHILQCQFGDNSIVPPLKYHSVRGIGTMLYAPSFTLNRLRSQAMQHVFQNLLTLWRIQDPNDRDRAKQILLMQNGIVPEGATIIPQQERHQIDPQLLDFGVSQMKQNIAENSTSFTPSADTGTKKERTKFEVQAQLQSASAMVSNVLSMMYAQEIFYYEELVRRILIKNTDDPTAIKFQEDCRKARIPENLLTPDNWNILPERVLGAGDNALGQAKADALMSQRLAYEPDSQQEILRMWTSQTLDDPDRALELVPSNPDQSTSGTRAAEDVYATLMRGIAVPMRKGIDHVGYCAALLAAMQAEIQGILQTDGMGTPDDVKGFQTVAGSVQENLNFLAMDDANKPTVKQLNDSLGQLMNEVKGMAQRQQEAAEKAQQEAQIDPAVQAKIQSDAMAAQQKMQISEATAAQKMEQKQQAFELKLQQQMQQHELKMATLQKQTEAALAAQQAKVNADLTEQGMRTAADLQAKGMETAADIAAKKAQAKANPPAKKVETKS